MTTYPLPAMRGSYLVVGSNVDVADVPVVDGAFLFTTEGVQAGPGASGQITGFYRGNGDTDTWDRVDAVVTGAAPLILTDVAPGDGQNTYWSILGTPTVGTFTLSWRGSTTDPIDGVGATAADMVNAVANLASILELGGDTPIDVAGVDDATLGADGEVDFYFEAALAAQAVEPPTISDSTDGGLTIVSTPGFVPTPEATEGTILVYDDGGGESRTYMRAAVFTVTTGNTIAWWPIKTAVAAFIAAPSGGGTVDAEARTAIAAVLELVGAHGWMNNA